MRLSISLLLSLVTTLSFAQQKGYYRSPAINGNTVIFTAEGDLWKYDIGSGAASRITTNQGMEANAIFSPGGQNIVFTAQYDGPTELYEMPVNGGSPRRLSWDMGSSTLPCGYTKEGKLVYSTRIYSGAPLPRLAQLDTKTLISKQIELFEASYGQYANDGVLYFTRFPKQPSSTKRYKGGWIEQVWKFDGTHEAVNLTGDYAGTSNYPMPYNGRIYFLSDRDGTMNIWSMNENGKELKQHTFSKGWDIQTPYLGTGKIIYQKGADIWLYNIADNSEKMLDISLVSDFEQRKIRWLTSPTNTITATAISPNGNYAAIISRGRVFVSPAKSDRWVELTPKSGIRYKMVKFINNSSLALLSDESGEFEVWKVSADGASAPVQITHNSKTMITDFEISPNEKYIAFTDKNEVLRIADTKTGDVKYKYNDENYFGFERLSWSPDSRYLSFAQGLPNTVSQLNVLNMQSFKKTEISTDRLNSSNQSWSADGNWIYFISERNFATKVGAPWGSRQPEPYYTNVQNIYALPTNRNAKFPFTPTDSWLADTLFNPVVSPSKDSSKQTIAKPSSVKNYDWDFAKKTLYELPLKYSNISDIGIADGFIYWLDRGSSENETARTLYALEMKESRKYEPTEIATGVADFEISANKKKILINYLNRNIVITNANGTKADAEKNKLSLNNWVFSVNPVDDWNQLYNDAWRMMRDYFYDRNMHNIDWEKMKEKYEVLLPRVTDRWELDDVLKQLTGELSVLHTYVNGGDKPTPTNNIAAGFLGAKLQKNDKGALIEHIYQADPDYPQSMPPLLRPGVNVQEGDIITAVNSLPVSSVNNIMELMMNKTGIPVKLSVLKPSGEKIEQIVKPFSAMEDRLLRYNEWELINRFKVDAASGNDIGYLHLKAMGSGDMNDFVKQYYPVFNRKGLIVDVRNNGGGNIDSWILEKLMRKAWMYWQRRAGVPYWNMQYAFRGPIVVICNQRTASDGEAFCEGFRRLGLGKVIGMRTWGGEVWLTQSNTLVDDGIASAAEMGVYGQEREWLIEGHGFVPDIELDNLPHETFKGKDAQLEYAIDFLKKEIKDKYKEVPKAPTYPNKRIDY